jgi:hypothetical protein
MKIRDFFPSLCISLIVFPVILGAQWYYIDWTDIIDNGDDDVAFAVAVDNSNNIIVTGDSYINGSDDYFTVKYDPDGTILWADTIENGYDDGARGVAVDNSNNIIVTGFSYINGNDDYFTVKYDPGGTILWADTIDNGSTDRASGVAVDNSNNIIVTGFSHINGNDDYFTVKYDPGGTVLWADTFDIGGDWATGVAVDNSNNIIVTGGTNTGSFNDFLTVKYDPNGTFLWADTVNNGDEDVAFAVATDDFNNIICTGITYIGVYTGDYFTVKYDSAGALLWSDTLDSGYQDAAYGVAVDNFNNIIVTGESWINIGGGDYYTVKYDPSGTIQWADTINNGWFDAAQGVAVDDSNNIIVTGYFYTDSGEDDDYFTVKYAYTSGISEDEGSLHISTPILFDIYPNPFTKSVEIQLLGVSEKGSIGESEIYIYDVRGRRVRDFILQPSSFFLPSKMVWDGRDESGEEVPGGVYFVRLVSGDFVSVKKLTLIR